ncbi:hypothetical protein LIER_15819 [Lithospermum erythrorhizon]|uniref:Secreted protein n=1 Tax=Lithospermum erythrorhizon TaxID=34254 RepID=A0AAV3Q6U2_LITER
MWASEIYWGGWAGHSLLVHCLLGSPIGLARGLWLRLWADWALRASHQSKHQATKKLGETKKTGHRCCSPAPQGQN